MSLKQRTVEYTNKNIHLFLYIFTRACEAVYRFLYFLLEVFS